MLIDSEIKCSYNGKYISVLNRLNGMFVILAINNNCLYKDQVESSLVNNNALEQLHLCSYLEEVHSGVAAGLEWHSQLEHFAVVQPLDP